MDGLYGKASMHDPYRFGGGGLGKALAEPYKYVMSWLACGL